MHVGIFICKVLYKLYLYSYSTCVFSAPKGELIRIDFRDSFHLEPSENCKYDYLEIRDGPQGYSKLLGRFCGSSFPPMITSSSRHLYLRFFSDDNVEYSGFRAVYSFVPRPPCKYWFALFGYFGHSQGSPIEIQDLPIEAFESLWMVKFFRKYKY